MSDTVSSLSSTIGSVALSNVLAAIVTLIICLIVNKALLRVVAKLLARTKLEDQIRKYMQGAIKLVLYVISALIVVDSLGIPITSLVAVLSAGSLGITLAAEDTLGNMAGGLVIMSSHPFAIGDFIEASGSSGTVTEISLNHTKLLTPNGQMVLLPNQELASSQIINYTTLGRRRIVHKIRVSYNAPTATVKTALQAALDETGDILETPAPELLLTGYGENGIEYGVYCWTAASDYWRVSHILLENIRSSFEKHNVQMTYNHLNVHIVEK